MATFVLWQADSDKKWHWHLKSDKNGEVVCWAEGYNQKVDAVNSIKWVKVNAKDAVIKEL